jgi:hypothetical protein
MQITGELEYESIFHSIVLCKDNLVPNVSFRANFSSCVFCICKIKMFGTRFCLHALVCITSSVIIPVEQCIKYNYLMLQLLLDNSMLLRKLMSGKLN